MPAATPTRFDSAMPTLKKRSGNFLAKKSVRVELWTSPSSTTTSGWASPSFSRARPNASRTDLPILRPAVAVLMASGSQEFQRPLRLLGGQRLAVVVGVLRQDRLDRPALHRPGGGDARLAPGRGRLVQRGQDGADVVAVDLLGEPAERLPARRQRLEVEHLGGRPGLLVAVLVDDGDEVVELVLLGGHGRFPDLPLV